MADNQEYEMKTGEYQQNGYEQKVQSDEQQQQQEVNGQGSDEPADSCSALAAGTDDDRKLFVGGLSHGTTNKELQEHFQKFGKIQSIKVKTDPYTGTSRGFAFVVFSQADSIDRVLSAGDHIIDNKKVDPKRPRPMQGKVYVGGLVPELSDDDIKNYFGQYGKVVHVEVPFDKTKNQRKHFCFVVFESVLAAEAALKSPKQSINGKEVDVKKATEKQYYGIGGLGGWGGRGIGRGYGSQGWGIQGGYNMPYSAPGNYERSRVFYDRGGRGGRGRGGYGNQSWGNHGGYNTPYSGSGNYGRPAGGYSRGKQRPENFADIAIE